MALLNIRPEGRYVDATLGSGGHSELILQQLGERGSLLAMDWDPRALERSHSRLQATGKKVILRRANFCDLLAVLAEVGWTDADGILFDLGVSSEQLLDSGLGMAFGANEPLDMRIDPDARQSAQELIRRWEADKLAELFEQYGQYRNARRLAQTLKETLEREGSLSARRVSELAVRILQRQGRTHPATRVFLALRSRVNHEMENLQAALESLGGALSPGGVGVFISFQSEEDRAVKNAFRRLAQEDTGEGFNILTPKPLTPTREEIIQNVRARSAKLRAIQKI